MKTRILVLIMFISATLAEAWPARVISGLVKSENGAPLSGVSVLLSGQSKGAFTDATGKYSINITAQNGTLIFSLRGYKTERAALGVSNIMNVVLTANHPEEKEAKDDIAYEQLKNLAPSTTGIGSNHRLAATGAVGGGYTSHVDYVQPQYNTEEYDKINENIFLEALKNPLSTFSIDVDAAAYSNVRRFINAGQQVPKDAVRIEEMINYFHYQYAQPKGEDPFAIYTEIAPAPWNANHKLVSIGLQGENIPTENLPASNLVFLIDVSGSMSDPNKLPLLKSSFKMLVEKLRAIDHVAIVVYAGAAGVVLPSTAGDDKQTIINALDDLQAGGSTAGGEGIELAYKIAKENFSKEGNNRVILATDGDFNVGESSNGGMERLIEQKRNDGIFLTVLGFGMGNYKDSKMEILADKGNGNYAYIDGIQEAKKVLISEFGGTLFTIAKDVKLQVEFNPTKVQAYRLIGYENRMLKSEDFNNDKKDAGDLGSGHTVTALYEIIPVGVESEFFKVDGLKYQTTKVDPAAYKSNELMTVKFRYKKPNGDVSKLIVHPLVDQSVSIATTSDNFRWAASVAGFGMLLQESQYCKNFGFDDVLTLAKSARGKDEEGYRVEFINLVASQQLLVKK